MHDPQKRVQSIRLWPLWVALTVFLALTSAQADTAVRFDRGLLWKIEKSNREPSYLFGTIHSDDPRVTQLPAPVQEIFERCSSFTMEMVLGGDDFQVMANTMFFQDERTLPSVLGEPLYSQVKSALRARGVPIADLDRKKPWAVVMTLSTPPPKTGLFLDLTLQTQATLAGKDVYGLETMNEQLAVFDKLTMPDQVALLKDTLATHQELDRQLAALIEAYIARDLGKLMEVAKEPMDDSSAANRAFMQRLLTNRNRRMVDRMEPRLMDGNAFIAIGTAHLPGDDGVLALLQTRGYRISRVY